MLRRGSFLRAALTGMAELVDATAELGGDQGESPKLFSRAGSNPAPGTYADVADWKRT